MGIMLHRNIGCRVACAFLAVFLLGGVSNVAAEDLTKAQVQTILDESIKDLLTGQPFGPDLEKKQLILRKMFEAGLITKPECIAMVERAMLPILEHHRTSRYILKDMPKRVEALLVPYMTWEEVKEAVWRMGSSLIKDGDQMVLTIGTLAPPGTPWINIPEKVLLPRGKTRKLKGRLLHFTHRDFRHALYKNAEYAWLGAVQRHEAGKRGMGLFGATIRAILEFFQIYILRGGFLDGSVGFLMAVLYSQVTFNKYAGLWVLYRQDKLKPPAQNEQQE